MFRRTKHVWWRNFCGLNHLMSEVIYRRPSFKQPTLCVYDQIRLFTCVLVGIVGRRMVRKLLTSKWLAKKDDEAWTYVERGVTIHKSFLQWIFNIRIARLRKRTRTFLLVDWLIIPNIVLSTLVLHKSKLKQEFPEHSLTHWRQGVDILLSYWYVGIDTEVFLQLWLSTL